MDIYNKLFELFIDKNNIREYMCSPFYNPLSKEVWATDAYILLMVKDYRDKCENIKEVNIDKDKILCGGEEINRLLTLKELQDCLSDIELEDEVEREICDECDGTRYVEYSYLTKDGDYNYVEWDCPVCSGKGYLCETKTGRKVINDTEETALSDVVFLAKYIDILIKSMQLLDVNEIKWVKKKSGGANLFVFNDNISVILMSRPNF